MRTVKVWDLAVRGSHLLFGLLVLAAFLTSEDDGFTAVHTRLGVVLLGVVGLINLGLGAVRGRAGRVDPAFA